MKQNCWEFMTCGRERGGINASRDGVCPAYTDTRLDGVHDGKNGGRACWLVAGTLCFGEVQGSFAQKHNTCLQCNFYNLVARQERHEFKIALELAHLLQDRV